MNLLFRTDEHITVKTPICRTDDFLDTLRRKLKFIRDTGKKHNATHVTSGDITDKEIYTSTNYLLDTINFVERNMPKTIGILGNHDERHRSMAYLEQSIASVFMSSGLFTLVDKPLELEKNVWLHGYSYGVELTHPDMAIYPEESKHIMLYHGYVYKEQTSMISGYNAEKLMNDFPEFDMFLTGDHHEKFVIEKDGQTLINGGPIYRGSINKIDYEPAIWLINTDDLSYEEVLIPIEKGVISVEHKEVAEIKKDAMDSVVNVVRDNEGIKVSFEAEVEALIESNSDIMNDRVIAFISRSMEKEE